MTQTDALNRSETPAPSNSLDGGMSMAPVVYNLGTVGESSRYPGVQTVVSSTDARFNQQAAAPEVPEPAVVRRRVSSDAEMRDSRRSRLRAAHTAAVIRAEAEGRALDHGRDTNDFVAAMRADIARATLHSQRPSLFGYVIRRFVSHRSGSTASAAMGAASIG